MLIAALSSAATCAYAGEPAPTAADTTATAVVRTWDGAHMSFVGGESHDFGDIQRKGGDLHCSFEFENDGSEPLVIVGMRTTCTCLKYEYPKQPIAPGQKSRIDITYEPHKVEAGNFHRVILVHSNSADGRKLLFIGGNSLDKTRP
ncbi:MAG: DUF1573 domain-containing protein [Alistipes sp.]|nr:DUF1573 domain-containing protein [Alistipes sp.]